LRHQNLTSQILPVCLPLKAGVFAVSIDNPTRKFLTNRIAAFFKFGPIKLIYSEKTPSRVKKQPAE
jgi:hypothetical protein